jgi:hypothetical protein
MDFTTAVWIGVALFLLILVPYLMLEVRQGKSRGHSWFNRFKPRGHSDIGSDVSGAHVTKAGMDEPRRGPGVGA